jgi:multiple sugar transport system permease protein
MSVTAAAGQQAISAQTRRRFRINPFRVLCYVFAIGVATVMSIPFLWTFSSALKSNDDIFTFPPIFFPSNPHWENFINGWTSTIGGGPDFTTFTMNSAIITVGNVTGAVLSCVLVAYGFSRFRFPGRNVLFLVMLSTMMIPYAITLIPLYILFSKIGWVDTFLPLIVPAYFGVPYFIFLLRQFFMSIPYDLDESARIDGAGILRTLFQILLPEIRPAIIAMAVLTFIGTWQDFLAPLVYLQSAEHFTIEVGLAQFYNSYSGQPRWDLITSVALVSMIPMVLLFTVASKYIVRGVTLSGMGGV